MNNNDFYKDDELLDEEGLTIHEEEDLDTLGEDPVEQKSEEGVGLISDPEAKKLKSIVDGFFKRVASDPYAKPTPEETEAMRKYQEYDKKRHEALALFGLGK